ncbi:MAG: MgtC/SapB family protein [Cytophagaceae bacterium]
MPITDFVLRLSLALILGAFVGFERQWRQRSAGLRTNTLVSVGAAAYILFSQVVVSDTMGDPTRVAGQIVTGIGFLGAGVIMREGLNVTGLNTAATIWCSAAVGSLAGAGMFLEAVITAAMIVLSHVVFRPLGRILSKRPISKSEVSSTRYQLTIRCGNDYENHIRVLLMHFINQDTQLQLRSLKSLDDSHPGKTSISAEIVAGGNYDQKIERAASLMTIERGVYEVSWEIINRQTEL